MSRFLSRRDLDSIANHVTGQYYRMLGDSKGDLTPIDPVLLAEEIVKLNVKFSPLCSDGSILGLAAFAEVELELFLADGNTLTQSLHNGDIVIDTALQTNGLLGRCNFTIAHETGHHILSKLYPKEYGPLCNRTSHIMYRRVREAHNWIEWQADSIASSLLMPQPLIMESLYRFSLGEKVEMLNRVFRPMEYQRFCDMADYLGVSKQALAIRLKQLGLLDRDKDYLANPYELVRIYVNESEYQQM